MSLQNVFGEMLLLLQIYDNKIDIFQKKSQNQTPINEYMLLYINGLVLALKIVGQLKTETL